LIVGFLDKAKELASKHDEQIDKALDQGGDLVDKRTGGKHSEQIDKGVDFAQEHTGEGDTSNR
jgi:MT0933-like antitoxin protein